MLEEKKFYSDNRQGLYLNYYKYTPEKVNGDLPLILHIHGAGSRGNDLSQLNIEAGALGEIKRGRKLNAIVVAPQCQCDTWFELFDVLLEFIDSMRNSQGIDKNRVYICGISMGAYTSWQVAMSRPDWFAALVPVCGGGMYWNAGRLVNLPIWAFHGALDSTVFPEESIHMVSAVNNAGGNAKLTIYADLQHNSWDRAFAEDELWDWIFKQERK